MKFITAAEHSHLVYSSYLFTSSSLSGPRPIELSRGNHKENTLGSRMQCLAAYVSVVAREDLSRSWNERSEACRLSAAELVYSFGKSCLPSSRDEHSFIYETCE